MNSQEYKKQLINRCYAYSLNIIKLIDLLDKKDFVVQILAKQLLRSATSIGANVIEAQAASSRKDFINFLNHALKSGNETKFWLGILRDSHKATAITVNPLLKETDELTKILGSSILKLKNK